MVIRAGGDIVDEFESPAEEVGAGGGLQMVGLHMAQLFTI